jgi:hypothetical protein
MTRRARSRWLPALAGLITGGLSAMHGFAAERADAIYRTGPETATARAVAVTAGVVTGLRHEVTAATQGDAPVPTAWIARAQLTAPRALTGPAPHPPVDIARAERAAFAMDPGDDPYWVRDYGDLTEGGAAVVFFGATGAVAVPSGGGEQALADLVATVVHIGSIAPGDRLGAALAWVAKGSTDAGRRAALRMALHGGADWPTLGAAMQAAWPGAGPRLRQFFTGAAGFALTEGLWPDTDPRPVDFICNAFAGADDRAAVGMLLQIKQLLAWSERAEAGPGRAALAEAALACLRARKADRPPGAELSAFYDQFDPKYGL